jgi:hypothetical protein
VACRALGEVVLLTTCIRASTPAGYQRRVRELVWAKPLPARPMLAVVPLGLRRVREGELLISAAPALALMSGDPGTGRWMHEPDAV